MPHAFRFPSLILLGLLAGVTAAQKEPPQPKKPGASVVVRDERAGRNIVKGQLLVTLHTGVNSDDLKPIFERFDAEYAVLDTVAHTNTLRIETDHDRLPELKQRLENHPYVASAAFNAVRSLRREVTDDPVFKKPADMPEDKDNWNLYRIQIPEAWEVTTGGNTVAVIDSGVVLDHEELVGRTVNPFSFATQSETMQEGMRKMRRGPKVYRDEEVRNHGTHVAVTIGGKAGNALGTAGVAPRSPIMPIQVLYYKLLFPEEEAGDVEGSDADITGGMAMAVDRRASVINMSLGGIDRGLLKMWQISRSDAERDDIAQRFLAQAEDDLKGYAPFIDRANRNGTIVVVAAGNEFIPAEFDKMCYSRRVIGVAATTRDDKRADFSNYGSYTTVSAPGNEIWSGFAEKDKPYAYLSGTSMACPHAAGVVSLMKSVDPEIRMADAAAILIRTGRALDTDYRIGPLIQARAALDETRRRREAGIREPELPPLIPEPGVNPTLPQLPQEGVELLAGPAPWDNPNVRRIFRLWLSFAIARAPIGGDANLTWFFNLNGQLVNANTVVNAPRPAWARFNYRWLWENAANLNSTNMGSLYEFTVGTLRSRRFNPAPTRVAENLRPGPKDPQPPKAAPLDPGLGKSKWGGKNGNGDEAEFDFGDKFVTIKKDGKSTRYLPKLNTYRTPMILNLYPEDGGDRIRCLVHMTDLGKFTLKTNFDSELPKDGGPNDPDAFKMHRTDFGSGLVAGKNPDPVPNPGPKPVPAGPRGFQESDGKGIDPRFAKVVVSDGTTLCAGDMGKFCGKNESAGPRTGIASKNVSETVPVTGHHWVVRKFKDPAEMTAYIKKAAKDPRFTVESFDNGMVGFKVLARDIGPTHLTDTIESYAKAGRPFEQSSHINTFIYRDFLVSYTLFEPKRGHDFKAESKRIADETKKLIDSRFPKE